jgi:hypothetical protein
MQPAPCQMLAPLLFKNRVKVKPHARDGAFTFGELISRLYRLEIECTKCCRFGRDAVHRLVDELGGDPGGPGRSSPGQRLGLPIVKPRRMEKVKPGCLTPACRPSRPPPAPCHPRSLQGTNWSHRRAGMVSGLHDIRTAYAQGSCSACWSD